MSIELNKIYNEDCLEGMRKLPDESVDMIVTSPPYNLGGDFHTMVNGKRVTYGDYAGKYKDNVEEKEYQEWQLDILRECYRVLKKEGVMFYNHKNRISKGQVISPYEWVSKSPFFTSQVIVMNLKSTANVDKRRFFPVHELIYVLVKSVDTKLHNDDCYTDVWDMKKVSRKKSGHPATFHVEMPTRCIIAGSNEGDVVLDPFMGSGTTAIACIETNRDYIGFELSDEYHKLSLERIKNHERQLSLISKELEE